MNECKIKGFVLNSVDLKEIVQQVLIWMDDYAVNGFPVKPCSFMPDGTRLIINLSPVIEYSSTRVILHEFTPNEFNRACTDFAARLFRQFYREGLCSAGFRSSFMLEHIYPNYTLRLIVGNELIQD